jgi:transglutaminase superfamily protein/uncharacterized protein DUF4129
MTARAARTGRPFAPAESLAAALALASLALACDRQQGLVLAAGAALGAATAALRRRGWRRVRLAHLVAVAPIAFVLGGRGACGAALVIVPWVVDAVLSWRTFDDDVLVHALAAATAALACVARAPDLAALALAVLQLFVSVHGIALSRLRRRDPSLRARGARPIAAATATFTLRAVLAGGLVFALVPAHVRSADRSGSGGVTEDGTRRRARGWSAGGSSVAPASPAGHAPTMLDPRSEVRLAGPTTIAYSMRLWEDGRPLRTAPNALLMKERVFERFDGMRWSADEPRFALVHDADDGAADGLVSIAAAEPGESVLVAEIETHGLSDRYAIPTPPLALEARDALVDRDAAIFARPDRNPVSLKFTARSRTKLRPPDGGLSLARAATDAPSCLFVPPSSPAIVDVAMRLRAKSRTAGELCLAIERWLRDRAPYVLESRAELPRDADPVADLILDGKGSHCETFAMAMALLCRLAGVPARVAVGYRGVVWSEEKQEFRVPAMWGHAWVEAKLDELGWIPFDPTPAGDSSSPSDADERSHASGIGRWLDLLDALVSGDSERRRAALEALAVFARANAAWLALGGLALAVLVGWRVRRALFRPRAAEPAAAAARAADGSLVRAYAEVRRFLVRSGFGIRSSTTPRETLALTASLPDPGARAAAAAIVADYESVRFGEADAARHDLAPLLRALRA